jgi:hypothetical protein
VAVDDEQTLLVAQVDLSNCGGASCDGSRNGQAAGPVAAPGDDALGSVLAPAVATPAAVLAPAVGAQAAGSGGAGEVHFIEEKVHAALGEEEEQDPCHWVLDTGASNHMTGSRAAFASIDTATTGTVRFDDGSVICIAGCGTILYECKNGEHRALKNVYYLPRLTTNIISIGQLDEEEYSVHIRHGVMQIRDDQQRLLAKVHRSPGASTTSSSGSRVRSVWPRV